MPSRRHRSPAAPATPGRPDTGTSSAGGRDPAEMFAAALRESEQREKAQREREREHREAAERKAAEAQAQERALADARRELDRAIAAVRAAKANGRGRAEADAGWKAAKARVIELETGEAPTWAPAERAAASDDEAAEPDADDAHDSAE